MNPPPDPPGGDSRDRLEEWSANAERHWQAIAADASGRAHALNKPLSTVSDTGALLFRLGLVLTELRPGVGHTVLDFAAGSCWLSSLLNRMRCRTVSVDVSPTALALGRELFALDPRHRPELEPRFVTYDGRRLPIEDAAVDRIVCFDAFHHVPNPEEILREFHRVLKDGGRAVFAEPGEGHSHMDRSLFETQRYRVLEQDLRLDEVLARARAAGFDRCRVKPYPDADIVAFDAREYGDFMAGQDGVYPLEALRESLRHFFVFVLEKGDFRPDSRNPGTLRAAIAAGSPAPGVAGREGATLRGTFRVRNTGDTVWLHRRDAAGGFVELGAHLLDGDGVLQRADLARAGLPRDVAPGEDVDVTLELPPSVPRGRHRLRLDMVDEHVVWFEQVGSPVFDVPLLVVPDDGIPDSRSPGHLASELVLLVPVPSPWRASPGEHLSLSFRVKNAGDTRWLPAIGAGPGTVALGGRLRRAGDGEHDFFRAFLDRDVPPGDSVEVQAVFAAPPEPGRYELVVDMVADGVCWFQERGSRAVALRLEVMDAVPDSRQPGVLRADIVSPSPRTLRAERGSAVVLPLDIGNTGNTVWLHSPEPATGHVCVGGRLRAVSGTRHELDFLRAPLPHDTAPGQRVAVSCTVAVPAAPGRYVVEIDMVDEGVAWFGARGSPTLTFDLTVR
jgi:SAM-dependent methyltransferase